MSAKKQTLNRKLFLLLLAVMGASSLLLLVIIFSVYRVQLENERREASREVNKLLQATLENAMLKRDIPGLQVVIDKLAKQPSINQVYILNPKGEVRFSSDSSLPGKPFEKPLSDLCPGCADTFHDARTATHLINDSQGNKVLRSVNPVRNHAPCHTCHGPPELSPVNGILIVDYDAKPIVAKAQSGLLWLLFSGILVIGMTFTSLWLFMRRSVLSPIQILTKTSDEISMGNLDARTAINSNDEFSLLGNTFDQMTERLQVTMHQLIDKEQYLQALIDAVPDGIRVIDSEFKILHANQAYTDLLGTQLVPNIHCYESSHNRDKPCVPTLVTCPIEEIRKQKKPIKSVHTFITEDGTEREVQTFSAPLNIMNAAGQEMCCIVQSIRDLHTDVKYSQEQRLATLGQLAAGVGHEILNPLTSIRLALQSTLQNLKESPDNLTQSIEYMELVDGEIDKCIDVTNRLLKLSTPQEVFNQLVTVNKAIADTVSLLNYEGEQKGVPIELDLDIISDPRILASESDIRMLTLNLIQNAFHAMPDGGELIISTSTDNTHVIIQFCDTGVGIPSENLAHVFDPFFSKRADGQRGMGLGLAICHSIAEEYSGTITAANRNTQGACITVTLPLAQD